MCRVAVCSRVQGNTPAIPRLNIPALTMNDGPQGFRANTAGTSTCWPSGLTMAASWNASAMLDWGSAMGTEFRLKGAAPGILVACNGALQRGVRRVFERRMVCD